MQTSGWASPLLVALLLALWGRAVAAEPNIVLILADDLGFSDTAPYGSEVRTPAISALADQGIRFSNYHTAASCAPTRGMLLTGVDSHRNGVPNIIEAIPPEQALHENYRGSLSHSVVTIATLLKDAGYHTYMAGKWHLGKEPDKIPAARGFERDFTLMQGAGSYVDDTGLNASSPKSIFTQDGKYLTKLPKGYYATKTYTDKMIEFISANAEGDKPFFGYLALTSPHWPLQVPDEYLDKYADRFDAGYDVIREQRFE